MTRYITYLGRIRVRYPVRGQVSSLGAWRNQPLETQTQLYSLD